MFEKKEFLEVLVTVLGDERGHVNGEGGRPKGSFVGTGKEEVFQCFGG